jgi:hypothetical protein
MGCEATSLSLKVPETGREFFEENSGLYKSRNNIITTLVALVC